MRRGGPVAEDGQVSEPTPASPEPVSILQFFPDERYTSGAFTFGEPVRTWHLPFLGWAVTGWHQPAPGGSWETAIVPVFLHENTSTALTQGQIENTFNASLIRLMPREPGGLR
jgi:hypothetical protein